MDHDLSDLHFGEVEHGAQHRLLGRRVLVKRCATEEKTAGGIFLPDNAKEKPQEAEVLALGRPTALYQLPQVTQNEMSPATIADLAARFPNFILFKDTSGADRVASAGQDVGDVFLVRGAEGDYARWLKAGGGPYDGFLLSTANCFGRELLEVITLANAGRPGEAQSLAERLSAVVKEVFALVASVPDGNAFANANKAMDHFFAHGPRAARRDPDDPYLNGDPAPDWTW